MNKKPHIIISMMLAFGLVAGCSAPQSTDSCQGNVLKTCNPTLYFDFNSTALNEQSVSNLDWVVEKFEKRPGKRIVVFGFADMVGDEQSNMKISKRRADAVKDYLVSRSIPEDKVEVHYVGKSQLSSHDVDKQDTERRVEVKVLDINKNGFDQWMNSLSQ